MVELEIKKEEEGRKLLRHLSKYMPQAPDSFFRKMLRKKNITLNKKRADGSEILTATDKIQLFLSEDTIKQFRGFSKQKPAGGNDSEERLRSDTLSVISQARNAYAKGLSVDILFENEDLLFVNKPAGILTHKASYKDFSLNEWLIGYLLTTKAISEEQLETFRPSVCNRLDRNTSGMVLCGKTSAGSRFLSELLRNRSLEKYYRLYAEGNLSVSGRLEGYLKKDTKSNRVEIHKHQVPGAEPICTGLVPIRYNKVRNFTYAEAELITGKSHQIRAHFAALGHPLVGDPKYASLEQHKQRVKEGVHRQLLHAYRLVFPEITDKKFSSLSGREWICPLPKDFPKDQSER